MFNDNEDAEDQMSDALVVSVGCVALVVLAVVGVIILIVRALL